MPFFVRSSPSDALTAVSADGRLLVEPLISSPDAAARPMLKRVFVSAHLNSSLNAPCSPERQRPSVRKFRPKGANVGVRFSERVQLPRLAPRSYQPATLKSRESSGLSMLSAATIGSLSNPCARRFVANRALSMKRRSARGPFSCACAITRSVSESGRIIAFTARPNLPRLEATSSICNWIASGTRWVWSDQNGDLLTSIGDRRLELVICRIFVYLDTIRDRRWIDFFRIEFDDRPAGRERFSERFRGRGFFRQMVQVQAHRSDCSRRTLWKRTTSAGLLLIISRSASRPFMPLPSPKPHKPDSRFPIYVVHSFNGPIICPPMHRLPASFGYRLLREPASETAVDFTIVAVRSRSRKRPRMKATI